MLLVDKSRKILNILNYTGSRWEFPMEIIENGNLIGSINGTVVGAELMTGRKGLALHTNGVDQYVDFGYRGDTCLGYFILCVHGWVAAFWLRRGNNNRPIPTIMSTGAVANRGIGIAMNFDRGMVLFRGDSKEWHLEGGLILEQVWAHVVVTWQLYSGAKLYIDGELVAAVTCPTNHPGPSTEETCFILAAGGCQHTHGFKGSLDELRVWDTVMSDEEVLALYTVDAGLN